ncbi:MAG TPA: hypothetical protein VGR53_10900 [Nitrososphaerales archaeon]|nr:hypothetical protein [Nitrososphaerales archaeon]
MSREVPVKASVLELLAKEPRRYSEIVRELGRPDKTVYVTLTALSKAKLVAKDDEGRYVLTDTGIRELERIRFVRVAEEEDDIEIIANTRLAIALGRCYGLLFDLRYLLSRTFKKWADEDRRRVGERLIMVRNLLLKYNPSLKKEELESEEKKTLAISLTDLLSGGVWWGKRFVKWGLKERYLHLLSLTEELPEGPARDEIFAALSLFGEVAAKLDERLKGLVSLGPTH